MLSICLILLFSGFKKKDKPTSEDSYVPQKPTLMGIWQGTFKDNAKVNQNISITFTYDEGIGGYGDHQYDGNFAPASGEDNSVHGSYQNDSASMGGPSMPCSIYGAYKGNQIIGKINCDTEQNFVLNRIVGSDTLMEKAAIEIAKEMNHIKKAPKKTKVPLPINSQPEQNIRTDLNGSLIKQPGDDKIFWIDGGKRRHITNPEILKKLFKFNDIVQYPGLLDITEGLPINDKTFLVKCPSGTGVKVFFVDYKTKRFITGKDIIEKYHLNMDHPLESKFEILDAIPDGMQLKYYQIKIL